jgi:hypothetical protein
MWSHPLYTKTNMEKMDMAMTKRNIGLEILDGIRQIKRGEHGRISSVPSV